MSEFSAQPKEVPLSCDEVNSTRVLMGKVSFKFDAASFFILANTETENLEFLLKLLL